MLTNWENLNIQNLTDQKKLVVLQLEIEEVINELDYRGAFEIYYYLSRARKEIDKIIDRKLKDYYTQSLNKLRIISIPYLAPEELVALSRNYILEGILIDEEIGGIKNFFKKRFVDWPYEMALEVKGELAKGLLENKEVLIVSGPNNDKGTIGGWIRDYLRFRDSNRNMDKAMAKAQYFFQNKTVEQLSDEDKDKLARLIDFYEYLSRRSGEFGGDDGVDFIVKSDGMYLVSEGKTKKIEGDVKVKNIIGSKFEQTPVLISEIFSNFLNTKFIIDAVNTKNKLVGSEVKILRNHFYQAVNAGNKEEAVAALLAIAERGKLAEAFGGDERFVNFWGDYLTKNNPTGREGFMNDPANAKDLARFLQYILEGRLKMKSDEATMVGILMSNSARVAHDLDYEALAYGEMESGEFRWNI